MSDLIEPIEIMLDKPRHLKITMSGMMKAERKLKELRNQPNLSMWLAPIEELGAGGFSMDMTCALLWAGLIHEDSALTFEQIPDLIDSLSTSPQEIIPKVRDGFMAFYKIKARDEDFDVDSKKKISPAGLNSGLSHGSSLA
jgi:hypothetical protein